MFETNRNGRPIPSQANINKVMDLHKFKFEFVTGEAVPVMKKDGDIYFNRDLIVTMIWERCVAFEFMFYGLEKAVNFAVWTKIGECWEERSRSK